MKIYEVVFKKSAEKELLRLPTLIQEKMIDAVRLLSMNPFTHLLDTKKLKGADSLFRIRIGDYRLVYSVDGRRVRIVVIRVAHRKGVY